MSISNAVLSAEDLKVELGGAPVLDLPSLHLYDQEVLTIVGPNGSGKSTLLLTLACLLKPVSGNIVFRGERIISRESAFRFRRKIAMVFQEPLLFDMTVFGNVAAGLRFRGHSKSGIRERVNRYLEMFRIEHLASRSARKLSGGESQRASLARAFAIEPEIIFLDEPFSALDPPTRHDLIHDLDTVVKSTGTTTVLVTHVESEALNLAGRIAVMNRGKIVQMGSPSDVMQNPANEFVAKLVGMETLLRGKIVKSGEGLLTISVSGREMVACGEAKQNEEVHCGIRPENVAVDVHAMGIGTTTENVFPGRITHTYSLGPFVRLSLDCGFPLVSFVTREGFADMGLAEGREIFASFRPASIHLIPADLNDT